MKFACVDGADFDGHLVNFDELSLRQKRFEREEKQALERFRGRERPHGLHEPARFQRRAARRCPPARCRNCPPPSRSRPVRACPRTSAPFRPVRAHCAEQPPEVRAHNFKEVSLGLDLEGALVEADRCLRCKKPRCIPGCPVAIDIPGFISALQRRDIRGSYRILKAANALPAVCGRVCPQESQCEATCVVGVKYPAGGDRQTGALRRRRRYRTRLG